MEQKVCLDTDVIIDHINKKSPSKIQPLLENTQLYVSTVSLFELNLRTTNREKVDAFTRLIHVLDFDAISSDIAASISRQLTRQGTPLDFRDVFIAATCIRNNCKLLTNNQKDFEKIKELEMV